MIIIKPLTPSNGFLEMEEFIDSGAVYYASKCNHVFYTTGAGITQYSNTTLLVGAQLTVYGYAQYNTPDTDLPFTAAGLACRLNFTGQFDSSHGGGQDTFNVLNTNSGSYKQYSSTSKVIGYDGNSATTDAYVQLSWSNPSNATTEGNNQGGTIAVANSSTSKKIYFRNNKLYGAIDPANDHTDAAVWASVLGGGGSGTSVVTAVLQTSNTNYRIFDTSGVSITITTGDKFFFAIPDNATDISTAKLVVGGDELIGDFSTIVANYTNPEGKVQAYKIWYTTSGQGGGTATWFVS